MNIAKSRRHVLFQNLNCTPESPPDSPRGRALFEVIRGRIYYVYQCFVNRAIFWDRAGLVRSVSIFVAFSTTIFAKTRGEFAIKTNVILTNSRNACFGNGVLRCLENNTSEVNDGTPEPPSLLLVPHETQYFRCTAGPPLGASFGTLR